MDLSKLKLEPHKLFHHLDELVKWKNNQYFPPIFVEFSPTDTCNQKCWYCYTDYIGHGKKEIRGDLLIKIFRDMGHAGVKSVMVQGTGEPLMNKSTPDAIIEGNKAGLSIALCTNGVLLTEEILEKVLPSIEWLRISAIELTPDLYAKSHGSPRSHYEKVIHNIKKAVEIRNRKNLPTIIAVHTLLFPYNVEYLVETVKMVKELGVDYILVKSANQSIHNPDHQWDRDTHKKYHHLLVEAKNQETKEFKVSVRLDQFEIQENCGGFKKDFECCYGIEFETMIDADGGVYPCLHFWRNPDYLYGNLYEQSFEEIWKGKKRIEINEKIYKTHNLSQCHFGCKHMHINKSLWELANPPMHVNFL